MKRNGERKKELNKVMEEEISKERQKYIIIIIIIIIGSTALRGSSSEVSAS
jgi:hypothetical protein